MEDPRVPAFSTLKYIEKFRDMVKPPTKYPNFGQSNFVVRIKKDGGHFGSLDNNDNLQEECQEFAWLDFLML